MVELGDAFGAVLRAALAAHTGIGPRPTVAGRLPRPVIEVVERDDGFVGTTPGEQYLPSGHWWDCERRGADRVRGRVLDVGCGAGRVALALQDKGLAVTGLDTSRGAIDVATHLGVRDVVRSTVDEHARSGERYDSFVLFGNNAGLLEGRERAPRFLAALAALARPGATAYVQGTDPYHTTDEVHLAYQERNRTLGRMGGQLRLRIRYRELSTDWFDYLLCSPAELAELADGTPWRLSDVDSGESPVFLGTLRLR